MKITFLGTGTSQGVPVIACCCEVCTSTNPKDKRLRSSLLIETNDVTLVIDTGPDFRQQMLRANVQHLDAVLFTHEHKDHTAGMDDIRAFNYKQQADMPIYARKNVIEQLKREFAYVFEEIKYPGSPNVEVHYIEHEDFKVHTLHITPVEVMHYRLPILGFRIGGLTYITDANYIAEPEIQKIKGSEVLVINALQKAPHISHFTLEEAIAMAQTIGAKQTYFTHISHRMGLHAEVEPEIPENMHLAYDGLVLEIS